MQYTVVNDIPVSRLVLGTDGYGVVLDNSSCHRLLDIYTDNGGTVIDTARSYCGGRSEACIGAWLKSSGKREQVFLSTKGGFPPAGHMEISRLSEEELRHDMEESLRTLSVDHVDIYWLHRDNDAIPVGVLCEICAAFVREGKTKMIGLSNWTGARIQAFNDYARAHGLPEAVASQIQFTTAHPNRENIDSTLVVMNEAEFSFYQTSHMPVFSFSSQAKGYFFKLENSLPLSEKASFRFDNDISRQRFLRLADVAKTHGISVGAAGTVALTSITDFPVLPILGCKSESQLLSSLTAADITFTAQELQYIFT